MIGIPGSSGSRTEAPPPSRTAPPLCQKGRARVTARVAAASTMVMHGGAILVDGIAVVAMDGANAVIERDMSPLMSVATYGQLYTHFA